MRSDLPVTKLAENVYLLNEFDGTNCYLVVGEKRALLIDCGTGFCDLRGAAEKLTDLLVIQLRVHPPQEHLLVRIRHIVEDLLQPYGLVLPSQPFLRRFAPVGHGQQIGAVHAVHPPELFQVGIVAVFGDLAQPDPNVAVPAKAVQGAQRLVKGLAGYILRQMRVSRKPPDVQKHLVKVFLIYPLKFRHPTTSFHL